MYAFAATTLLNISVSESLYQGGLDSGKCAGESSTTRGVDWAAAGEDGCPEEAEEGEGLATFVVEGEGAGGAGGDASGAVEDWASRGGARRMTRRRTSGSEGRYLANIVWV
ncbi:hypothetical protein HK104_005645 [Borealophlyctis nickersoniae]|nr:hypothetical protein HK104_005645 [Borealophlyctis nickersoniae]